MQHHQLQQPDANSMLLLSSMVPQQQHQQQFHTVNDTVLTAMPLLQHQQQQPLHPLSHVSSHHSHTANSSNTTSSSKSAGKPIAAPFSSSSSHQQSRKLFQKSRNLYKPSSNAPLALAVSTELSDPVPSTPRRKEAQPAAAAVASSSALMMPNSCNTSIFQKPLLVDRQKDNRQLLTKMRVSQSDLPKMESLNSTFVQGVFSQYETEAIHAAILKYIAQYSIPESDIHYLVSPKTYKDANPHDASLHKDFHSYIHAESRLNRTRMQVWKFVTRRYQLAENGGKRWSSDEDDKLMRLYELKSGKWSIIETEMGRKGCRERYRVLNRNGKQFRLQS